jgi:hypothetical protein
MPFSMGMIVMLLKIGLAQNRSIKDPYCSDESNGVCKVSGYKG